MDDRELIYSTLINTIEYHGSSIPNEYLIAQELAWDLGFTEHVANLIRNVFFKYQVIGNIEEDSKYITEEIIKIIWK